MYDVTVGYPKGIVASEMDLLKTGVFPGEVHFDVRRVPVAEVLEPGPDKWLQEAWRGKEARLRRFYEQDGHFQHGGSGKGYLWPVSANGSKAFAPVLDQDLLKLVE